MRAEVTPDPVGPHVRHIHDRGGVFGLVGERDGVALGGHLRVRRGLPEVAQRRLGADLVLLADVDAVQDRVPAGNVLLQVPDDGLALIAQDRPERDRHELAATELRYGGVGGNQVDPRVITDVGVPGDAQVHAAHRRAVLGAFEERGVRAVVD